MGIGQTTEDIKAWAIERNLHVASPEKQMLKLIEEVGEMAAGLARGDEDEIKDGIGDVKVVTTILKMQLENIESFGLSDKDYHALLLIYEVGLLAERIAMSKRIESMSPYIDQVEFSLDCFAHEMNTSIEECAQIAYDEIKDRKGKMIDGVFVKESDL